MLVAWIPACGIQAHSGCFIALQGEQQTLSVECNICTVTLFEEPISECILLVLTFQGSLPRASETDQQPLKIYSDKHCSYLCAIQMTLCVTC